MSGPLCKKFGHPRFNVFYIFLKKVGKVKTNEITLVCVGFVSICIHATVLTLILVTC